MTQARPVSPCIDVCVLDAARTCVGCRRTIDEIARWGRMSATEQWQVIARLERIRQQEGFIDASVQAPRRAER
jgi:predicted Fe-S protein YdhL (DUF1289 family)